jgi:hypothetical protein
MAETPNRQSEPVAPLTPNHHPAIASVVVTSDIDQRRSIPSGPRSKHAMRAYLNVLLLIASLLSTYVALPHFAG